MNTATQTSPQDSKPDHENRFRAEPPLERPAHGRMAAGVAAGAARYAGVDPTVIRILFVALVFAGGLGVPLYLAGWLLIPEEGRSQSLASELIQSFQSRSR